MLFFHDATVEHLDIRPRITMAALGELARTQRRLGVDLPPSVREWYAYDCALSVLSEHSNDDPPIPVEEFVLTESMIGPLIQFRRENQGVCTWAILRDGSMEDQADWFVGAADAISLEAALRIVSELDGVGKSFYDRSDIPTEVLAKLKRDD